MHLADVVDRLAAVDHDLGRLEALRALAQTKADSAEIGRLEEEIRQAREMRDILREQLKGFGVG
jgi:hypothetical protein